MIKKMSVKAVSLLLTILTLSNTQNYEVPCPTTSNNSQYVDCYSCVKYPSYTYISCDCDKYRFNLLGRCVRPKMRNCYQYPYFVDLVTNSWNDIGMFWIQKINDSSQSQPDSFPLPRFLNFFDFDSMSYDYKVGWIQAYFLYKILKPEIELLNIQRQRALLFQTMVFIDSIINQTLPEMRRKILSYTNLKLQKNWTEIQFQRLIDNRLKNIISCFQCEYQFGLAPQGNSSRVICKKCPQHCGICTNNATQCKQCVYLYSLTNSLQCKKCPPNCGTCKNNATECTQCLIHFALLNQTKQCLACNNFNCKICDQQGVCSECLNNIPLNSENQCITHDPPVNLTPCLINGVNSPCASCPIFNQSNSIWANNQAQCFICPDQFCQQCNQTNSSQCFHCIQKFYWNQNSKICIECPQSCLNCSQNICHQCDDGFGPLQNGCQPCKTRACKKCNINISQCDQCYNNFQLSPTDTCQLKPIQHELCPVGCYDCYESNHKQCFSCQNGYFMENAYRICRKCKSNCEYCISSTTCSKCFLFYTLVNGACVRCPDNCIQCNSVYPANCEKCLVGYQLVNKQCIKVQIDECIYFSSINSSQCLLCKKGFTLHPNGLCMQCSINCEFSCNPFNINQCRKTKYLMQMAYLLSYYFAFEGCFLTINGECLFPLPGYLVEQQDGKLVAKYSCRRPCLTCNESNIMQCFSCVSGYVLSDSKCVPDLSCNPNCISCSVQSYRDVTTNNCIVCSVQNCGSCFNGECLECHDGYYLENGICTVCSANCKTCLDAKICKICARGYVYPYQFSNDPYSAQICVKCSPNCRTCFFSETTCSSCHPNSRLINARCFSNIMVAFQYKLNVMYIEFLMKIRSEAFIEELSRILNINSNEIFIQNITQGSTIINGQISTKSEEDAKNISNTLQTNSLTNFPVLENTLSILKNGELIQCTSSGRTVCSDKNQSSNRLSQGAIIGISIGSTLTLVMIMIAIIIIVNRQQRKIYNASGERTRMVEEVKTKDFE